MALEAPFRPERPEAPLGQFHLGCPEALQAQSLLGFPEHPAHPVGLAHLVALEAPEGLLAPEARERPLHLLCRLLWAFYLLQFCRAY